MPTKPPAKTSKLASDLQRILPHVQMEAAARARLDGCQTDAEALDHHKGKSYRSFGPAGPVLLLLDAAEWKRWPELRMRLSVNGQVRQETLCGDMLFAPHQTLSELSALQDLHAGDLIATGTPAGCAAKAPGKLVYFVMNHLMSPATKWKLFIQKGLANPLYLKPGDQMSASIRTDDGALDLGEQHNRIVAA